MGSELIIIDAPDMVEVAEEDQEENEIGKARRIMREAFEEDPGFKSVYEANIACLLMDNIPGLKWGQKAIDLRNKVATMIMDRMFS